MTKRKARSQDEPGRKVVRAFVAFLSNHGHSGLKVDWWAGIIEESGEWLALAWRRGMKATGVGMHL